MYKCTVYDRTGKELSPALSSDAIVWIMEGNAHAIQYYDDGVFLRTVKEKYPVPLAIVLTKEVRRASRKARRVGLTNFHLFLRDNFTCQYCGRHDSKLNHKLNKAGRPMEQLEREHVVPRSLGGENSWENCVTACTACNSAKGNRTPEQAGLKLRTKPYEPSWDEMEDKKRKFAKAQFKK